MKHLNLFEKQKDYEDISYKLDYPGVSLLKEPNHEVIYEQKPSIITCEFFIPEEINHDVIICDNFVSWAKNVYINDTLVEQEPLEEVNEEIILEYVMSEPKEIDVTYKKIENPPVEEILYYPDVNIIVNQHAILCKYDVLPTAIVIYSSSYEPLENVLFSTLVDEGLIKINETTKEFEIPGIEEFVTQDMYIGFYSQNLEPVEGIKFISTSKPLYPIFNEKCTIDNIIATRGVLSSTEPMFGGYGLPNLDIKYYVYVYDTNGVYLETLPIQLFNDEETYDSYIHISDDWNGFGFDWAFLSSLRGEFYGKKLIFGHDSTPSYIINSTVGGVSTIVIPKDLYEHNRIVNIKVGVKNNVTELHNPLCHELIKSLDFRTLDMHKKYNMTYDYYHHTPSGYSFLDRVYIPHNVTCDTFIYDIYYADNVLTTCYMDCENVPYNTLEYYEIIFGPNVKRIDIPLFFSSFVTSITIPDNVTSLGNNIFHNCSNVETIEIGSGITSVDTWFCSGKLTNLKTLICKAPHAPWENGLIVEDDTFPATGTFYYPRGADYSAWISSLPSGWVCEEKDF